jgi:hypothetical protein
VKGTSSAAHVASWRLSLFHPSCEAIWLVVDDDADDVNSGRLWRHPPSGSSSDRSAASFTDPMVPHWPTTRLGPQSNSIRHSHTDTMHSHHCILTGMQFTGSISSSVAADWIRPNMNDRYASNQTLQHRLLCRLCHFLSDSDFIWSHPHSLCRSAKLLG